jgi:putative transposase
MSVDASEHTTSMPNLATSGPSSPQEMVQEAFHQHLREQIRCAVKIVMEEIMREELTLFLGAEYGEVSPERKGYRNGSYTRDLSTSTGKIEDLQVLKAIAKDSSIPSSLTVIAVMNNK